VKRTPYYRGRRKDLVMAIEDEHVPSAATENYDDTRKAL